MPEYYRKSELQAFDDSKTGVKGLVDAGVTKIPSIFVHDHTKFQDKSGETGNSQFSIPTIDLEDMNKDETLRSEIVEKVRDASEKWGFFQVVNHGIPISVMDEMIDGVPDLTSKIQRSRNNYSRDVTRRFVYNSNFNLCRAPAANWRDTISCIMAPHPPDLQQLPPVCRDIMMEYSKYVMRLGLTLFELLSEALGLNSSHLKDMNCAEGLFLTGHYYRACPEPERTFGTSSHFDSGFITILLQDQLGGLQVPHENQRVDVPPLHGALAINIADLLQLISNDKFKSVNHRAFANKTGPRISVASFFRTHLGEENGSRIYGPIKEDSPPIYRETTIKEFITHSYKKGLDGTSSLSNFKLSK